MNQAGTTVYIDVSVTELINRLYGKGQNKRPILAGKSEEELKIELEKKVNLRNEFFYQADFILTSDKANVKELLTLINP